MSANEERKWIRLYRDILGPLWGVLSDTGRALWVELQCACNPASGVLPPLKALAWMIRRPEEDLRGMLDLFAKLTPPLLCVEDGTYYFPNWSRLQPPVANDSEVKVPNREAGEFWNDRIRRTAGGRISAKDVYADYRKWCMGMGYFPMGTKTFYGALRAGGVDSIHTRIGKAYLGFRFRKDEEA